MSYQGMKTSHLADNEKPTATLCGLPWEIWQEPDIPTDAEIGYSALSEPVKKAVRESDRVRREAATGMVTQCQACLKAALL
jgi:hypothetical protein